MSVIGQAIKVHDAGARVLSKIKEWRSKMPKHGATPIRFKNIPTTAMDIAKQNAEQLAQIEELLQPYKQTMRYGTDTLEILESVLLELETIKESQKPVEQPTQAAPTPPVTVTVDPALTFTGDARAAIDISIDGCKNIVRTARIEITQQGVDGLGNPVANIVGDPKTDMMTKMETFRKTLKK